MLLICWLFFFGSSTIATAQSVEREIVTNTVDFDGIQIADLTPSFKTGVNVVSLNITVTDDTAGFVTDLKQEDLLVYEDGVLQKTTYFSRRQLPIALALLMDTSASMDERMETAQEAAIGFSRRLRPDDLAEIIDFDSRVDILQPFTNSLDKLESAIRQTSAGGSTSLYNALYISLKELKKAPLRVEDVRREAIVVLSDGEDTSSLVTFEEVLDIAKRSETAIYSIGINTDDGSTSFREADFVLRQLAQETGGRAFFPDDTENLAGIYEQISDELSSQYSVGYVSANPLRDGRWRRIVVRTNREKIATRTKQGYFGPTSN
jgi:Ca-activated chloride channel family protein